jgi:uncharacterized protein
MKLEEKDYKGKKQKYTIQELRDKGLVFLEYISGSQMYGTNTDKSDVDIKGIFIMPNEDFADFSYSPDWEEVSSGKFILPDGKECEITFYELRKFLKLLEKSNPNVLEIFDIPEDCIIYKHPFVDILLNNKDKFITKKSFYSFSGYALDQTNKAHGKEKKQNWEAARIERKTILDFCYVQHKQGSMPIKEWFKTVRDITLIPEKFFPGELVAQHRFGLAKIPHMTWTYGIYEGDGLSGFVNNEETSELLKVSQIPKGLEPIAILQFNESAWSIHCDEYKSYQEWLTKRNDARWVDVKGHNQKIDGKNMLHMQRLINMATDIATGKGIVTRRPEAKELLKIRKGDVPLQELLDSADSKLKELKTLYDKSDLPDEVPPWLSPKLDEIRLIFTASPKKTDEDED